jgi:hypothetical protein
MFFGVVAPFQLNQTFQKQFESKRAANDNRRDEVRSSNGMFGNDASRMNEGFRVAEL